MTDEYYELWRIAEYEGTEHKWQVPIRRTKYVNDVKSIFHKFYGFRDIVWTENRSGNYRTVVNDKLRFVIVFRGDAFREEQEHGRSFAEYWIAAQIAEDEGQDGDL